MVGACDLGGRTGRGARRHDLGGRGGSGHRGRHRLLVVTGRPLRRELVEPAAEPFGKAAGVGEDDRGPVLLDQVEHPLLHVRPDRALSGGRRGDRGGAVRSLRADKDARHAVRPGSGRDRRGRVEVGHVLDRHHDLDLDLLTARRRGDRDRPGPAQERGYLLGRPDRRRQPDPLSGAGPGGWPLGTRRAVGRRG